MTKVLLSPRVFPPAYRGGLVTELHTRAAYYDHRFAHLPVM
jgi:hypothetical protein